MFLGNFSILFWEAFINGEVIIVFRFDEKVVEAIHAKISIKNEVFTNYLGIQSSANDFAKSG